MSEVENGLVPICTYSETNSDTGERRACSDAAISPAFPYCYLHTEKMGKLAKKQDHDRYASSMPDQLRDHYNHQLKDDKPLNLLQEIAQTRAMVADYMEQIKNAATQNGVGVLGPEDKLFISHLLGRTGKLAEIEARINPRGFWPIEEVKDFFGGLIDGVANAIPNSEIELRERLVGSLKKFCAEQIASNTVKPLALRSSHRGI